MTLQVAYPLIDSILHEVSETILRIHGLPPPPLREQSLLFHP
jgi:hypothetical protein